MLAMLTTAIMLSTMPLVFDHASQPFGGHSYPDPSGVTLKGKTARELLANITTYRRNNGIAIGSPEADVEAHYRVVHPHLVSGETKQPAADPVERWLNRIWRTPPQPKNFVEAEPLSKRLDQCRACPHYAKDHAYSAESSRRLIILGVGNVTDFAACKVRHWPVGLAALMPTHDVEALEGCWASRE
jgi:hypothetical protein